MVANGFQVNSNSVVYRVGLYIIIKKINIPCISPGADSENLDFAAPLEEH